MKLSPTQETAFRMIRDRGVYGDAQGRGVVDGGELRIARRTIRSLFDRGLVEWSTVEQHRIVPSGR